MNTFITYILISAIGGTGSLLANKGIAVFNDGLRPIIPEYLDGRISRAELATSSFAISFGLIIGFGIPISIGTTIIIAHSVLLAADIIGTSMPENRFGAFSAFFIGAIYGSGLLLGLSFIVDLFEYLPFNFLDSLSSIGDPILFGFCAFPVIVVMNQHGLKKALITFFLTFFTYVLMSKFGIFQAGPDLTITFSPVGSSLLVGMLCMIIFSAKIKGEVNSNDSLTNLFSDRVLKIKKNWFWLAIMGGLITSASSMQIMAIDVLSQQLLLKDQVKEAAMAALARSIGFIPLVFSTAIVTGVYGMAGTTIVFALGLLLKGYPLIAFIVGFIWIRVEIQALTVTVKVLEKFPGLREMGEYIRDSLHDTISIALLIGSAIASNTMAPNIGFFWIICFWLLNKKLEKPIIDIAVGPIATITLGMILNIFYFLGFILS